MQSTTVDAVALDIPGRTREAGPTLAVLTLGDWQSVPRQSEAEWPRGFAYRDAGLSDENWRLERIRNVVDWCGHARWGRCMPMRPFGRNTSTMIRIEKMTTSDHELPMN